MKLKKKLVILFLVVGILPILAISISSIVLSSNALRTSSFNQLLAIREIKKNQLINEIETLESQLKILKDDPYVLEALNEFDHQFEAGGDTVNSPEYRAALNKYDARLQDINHDNAWYDLFLIHIDADIVYTAAGESDLGMIIPDSSLINSPLGTAFKEVLRAGREEIVFSDFAPYAPSNDIPSAFMMTGMYDKKGELAGYVAFQVPLDKINKIMQQRDGMGESGESYLVGKDKLMRSDSFLDPVNHSVEKSFSNPGLGSVETDATKEAFAGKSDVKIIIDYTGHPVLSAYTSIDVMGKEWAVIAEINKEEVDRPIMLIVKVIIVSSILIIFLVLLIALLASNGVLKQLGVDPSEIAVIATSIADGDLQIEFDSKKPLVGVYKSLYKMVERLHSIVKGVQTGSEQIATASEQLAEGNQNLAVRTEVQASSLEETSAAIEEMNSSIKSNAENTITADQLSRDALNKTKDGSVAVSSMITSMNDISTSSNRIADIIEVINNIAFQTNLLALNASIEAARAGEQGKGFAVVAVEVRKLAKRSDKAATEIAGIIKSSNKKVSEGVVIANSAGDVLTEISSAVNKVTVLIGEISASSQEQLTSAQEIDNTLSGLDENTQKNGALVEEAAAATEELSAQSSELNNSMKFFKVKNNNINGSRHISLNKPVENIKTETETYQVIGSISEDEFKEF